MEIRPIKRVGVTRPKKGIKVVDLAQKRSALGRKKKRGKGKMGPVMMILA
ncbi:MAG: hypothetical protein ACE5IO_07565 [Thermoplasmata archaeon]